MARIKPMPQPFLPFGYGEGMTLSSRSLPSISAKLYAKIATTVAERLRGVLKRTTSKRLRQAAKDWAVTVTTTTQVEVEIVVTEVLESRVRLRLGLPLRGAPADIDVVLEKFLSRFRLRGVVFAENGALGTEIVLLEAPVKVEFPLSGSSRTRSVLVTKDEARLYESVA
jgi:hypothetical protein